MAEGEYGRLFTFEDVCTIVGLAQYGETGEQVVAEAERLGMLTFPADEPLFLLRGQDAYAPSAVSDYLHSLNTALEHRLAVERAADRMIEWQVANPDRVKVPG